MFRDTLTFSGYFSFFLVFQNFDGIECEWPMFYVYLLIDCKCQVPRQFKLFKLLFGCLPYLTYLTLRP